MDVILLCGGFGKRMEPIGLFIPKALLPIKGRPLLDHIIEDLGNYKEVERIIISTNKKFIDQFEYYVNSKREGGFGKKLELIIEHTSHDGEKLGAIRGVEYVLEKAGVKNDFMIIAGDNYYEFDLKEIIAHFEKTGKATICLHDVKSIEEAKRFGVVELRGERMIGFEEKPENPKSTLISTVIYALPKESVEMFRKYISEKNNPDALGHFVKWYMQKEETHGIVCKGNWFDIGTFETYKRVFEMTSNK
ncbi:MAG: nucleotidyltransferase family protein [Candidatus Micrarchaeota archaeon]|nr:nucleotidyltransferase family protein [Candidatus Micrarchaeota archaeon]